ncbi:hypothetical protein JOF29_002270 [Kribbella aluminosa]|uniref:Uncharacterized protein n=1 Tax=Kribbella aluminosa TaxID=416017 RepID=A0ABS4UHT6_9ACTN|nr:hypothetical protein [Kribbella aluminosa]MBP2351187.1 hypothetical protein [Kribbella aluminosa]
MASGNILTGGMMTELEASETLRHWARTRGMDAESIGGDGWTAVAHRTSWVIAPRGRSDAVYLVTSTGVQSVNRSTQSLAEVLADLD